MPANCRCVTIIHIKIYVVNIIAIIYNIDCIQTKIATDKCFGSVFGSMLFLYI